MEFSFWRECKLAKLNARIAKCMTTINKVYHFFLNVWRPSGKVFLVGGMLRMTLFSIIVAILGCF